MTDPNAQWPSMRIDTLNCGTTHYAGCPCHEARHESQHAALRTRAEKAEATLLNRAGLAEQHALLANEARAERDLAERMLAAANETIVAVRGRAEAERDEARRELERHRHGNTIEGDDVCPNELRVRELEEAIRQALRERDDGYVGLECLFAALERGT
jgi:flagellar biosynthesis GTPase FlhF